MPAPDQTTAPYSPELDEDEEWSTAHFLDMSPLEILHGKDGALHIGLRTGGDDISLSQVEAVQLRDWLIKEFPLKAEEDPARLPLPPNAPAGMVYLDRATESPRLRSLIEQAKRNAWRTINGK